jgi:hypothetical protein
MNVFSALEQETAVVAFVKADLQHKRTIILVAPTSAP